MVERYRNAQPVLLGKVHGLPDEIAIVDDIEVGERGALGHAGGAARELDVDRIIRLQEVGKALELRLLTRPTQGWNVAEPVHAGLGRFVERDQGFQVWQRGRGQVTGSTLCKFRRKGAQHAEIITALERAGSDERRALDLVQRIFQLSQTVGRIDVDQDEPGLGRGELCDHPLEHVGRPDPDAVPGLEPERHQPRSESIHARTQFGIGETNLLMPRDDGQAFRPAGTGVIQKLTDRAVEQGLVARPTDIAQCTRGVHQIFPPSLSSTLRILSCMCCVLSVRVPSLRLVTAMLPSWRGSISSTPTRLQSGDRHCRKRSGPIVSGTRWRWWSFCGV